MDKIICAKCRHCEHQRSNLEKNFNGTSIWIASLMLAMTDLYATKVVHATMPCEHKRSNPEQNFNGTSIWIASLTLAMTGFYAAKGVPQQCLAGMTMQGP